jgi:Protein of unknown function (DUF1592)/Protein of unknown function (DUF1588)/Protein of unknown function (DUF1587)/Protein of unknown function (DUF1585)/Protein of unknown function (DUF1595)/Planctomycete cytochrome C
MTAMSPNPCSSLFVIVLGAALGCIGCGTRVAEPPPTGPAAPRAETLRREELERVISLEEGFRSTPVYAKDVEPIFEKYCLNCHDAASAEGGVILENVSHAADEILTPLLHRVAQNLRSESMPPEGEPRPDAAELEILSAWVDGATSKPSRAPDHPQPRRLNRAQYNNTIRDLFGLDLRPADDFPSDDVGYGFDNIGEVLSTSPILIEMYVAAAEKVIGAAFESRERRARIMNPSADFMPAAFRRFLPPVRTPRENKVLRTTPIAVDPELQRQQKIYDILRGFADRAYRRPATHDELLRLLEIVISAEKDGESMESGISLALQAVLASPHFLFVGVTSGRDTGSPERVLPRQDFELAERLSYFLWSSAPDEELLRLASQGALHVADQLEAQVKRMLRDRRSLALAEQFASQWLQIRKLSTFTPDPKLFPEFDAPLKDAMLEEAKLFFASIMDEDRSVLDFLNADYTFVNERLARHYGFAGVEGEAFRRVSIEGTARGGLVTMASVLTATSNPTRTSPVKRGRWILENILGAPPAPPPAGVEALKESRRHAGTLREQMEQHRSSPECASCHRRMDPPGFALENFDALGRWREQDSGQVIDAGGRLPGGRAFRGPDSLKIALSSRRDAFARCLAEKMLTYALGRGVGPEESFAVQQIVRRLKRNEYRFSSLVLGIVESDPFSSRKRQGEGP